MPAGATFCPGCGAQPASIVDGHSSPSALAYRDEFARQHWFDPNRLDSTDMVALTRCGSPAVGGTATDPWVFCCPVDGRPGGISRVQLNGEVLAMGKTQAALARKRSAAEYIPGVKVGQQLTGLAKRVAGARLGHLVGTRAHLFVLAEDKRCAAYRLTDVVDWEMKTNAGTSFLEVRTALRDGSRLVVETRPPGTGTVVTALALGSYVANVRGNVDLYRARRERKDSFAEVLAGYLSLVPMA